MTMSEIAKLTYLVRVKQNFLVKTVNLLMDFLLQMGKKVSNDMRF